MNLVCTIDKNYIEQCVVTLISVLENTNEQPNIFIVHNNIQKDEIELIKISLLKYKCNIHFITISDKILNGAPVSHHITVATYFRILLPEILPLEIEKVIFIDCDIIVKENLGELFKIDISKYSHAAVINPFTDSYSVKKRLDIKQEYEYFNAGVLLINIKFWRNYSVTEKALNYLKENFNKIEFWDQDVLNFLFQGMWLELDPKWNVQFFFFFNENQKYYPKINFQEIQANPCIIHYTGGGKCKPWHYYSLHPKSDEYIFYKSKSPFHKTKLIEQPSMFKKIRNELSNIKNLILSRIK